MCCACCCFLQTREYFIAAEEEVWDYVPFGGEMCGGSKVNFSDNAKTFVQPGPDRVGNKYLKARYVEYTDATFTQKKVRGNGIQICRAGAGVITSAASVNALADLLCAYTAVQWFDVYLQVQWFDVFLQVQWQAVCSKA